MKLLIAEDDTFSRTLLQSIVSRWDFDVVAVADGNEAWRCLQQLDAPRLALLDWQMPGMDGIEVCRKVRSLSSTEPPFLILLTARDAKSDIVEGLQAGANDYITKPYDNNELLARLEVGKRVLELQQALAERVNALESALAQVKTLQGILPICMYCHKIRTDREGWDRLEKYITEHSDAQLSHGICPECLQQRHSDLIVNAE